MIDAQIHLWDRRAVDYPWLDALPAGHRLRRAATPARLLAALPQPLDGVVHVEAAAADGLAETHWLTRAAGVLPCPVALVAHVPMAARNAPERLAAQAMLPGVVGIHETATWHPDAARRRINDPDRLESPTFRRAAAAAAHLGFCFDLMISPFQAEAVARLAQDFPDLRLVLDQCGGPMNHGREGRALWLDGMQRMAELPNVAVKLTDPTALHPDAPRGWVLDVLTLCLDVFGPARAIYGSDWPMAGIGPSRWADLVAKALDHLPPAAQARVWWGTARSIYFKGPRPPLIPADG